MKTVRARQTERAAGIMDAFLERTGVTSAAPPKRYLWTDAFAVCNLLELQRRTGQTAYLRHAGALIDQVHQTLGRHRADDPRSGWISGLGEEEGRAHPTRGGLRIGKERPERRADEPFDERLEWSRDGQYFHYLTRWMHALSRYAEVTKEPRYLLWALELAEAAHGRFTYVPAVGATPRMYWKMSIDLTRPLVPSMGHHDPLDGLLTFLELSANAAHDQRESAPRLHDACVTMERMCAGVDWTTTDLLGLGGLLADAWRLAQMIARGAVGDAGLFALLLDSAHAGLVACARIGRPEGLLAGPASSRLAFRELGLAIGLQGVERIAALWDAEQDRFGSIAVSAELQGLRRFLPWVDRIEAFWLDPGNQETTAWIDHEDINAVMLATSLLPDGYLGI